MRLALPRITTTTPFHTLLPLDLALFFKLLTHRLAYLRRSKRPRDLVDLIETHCAESALPGEEVQNADGFTGSSNVVDDIPYTGDHHILFPVNTRRAWKGALQIELAPDQALRFFEGD